MADLTITAANVVPGADAMIERGTSGATITAGQIVARNTDNDYVLADANHATVALRTPRGIALHGASAGQPLAIARSGDVTLGAVLTAGTDYWLSDVPGGIAPRADVATGERAVLLGVAESTTVLRLDIQDSGVTL